ncbi:MAG: chemotaxis response regulator protein-glutamate methylesterase [Methylococcales bacterium]|nr:chemotaxis response regulator protein-glutamate methylesterase [Methylococcales bacterium]MBT7442668.1 chemotaxis response regulator protein-glutamate methylesterase [Methylococcales bacterium]
MNVAIIDHSEVTIDRMARLLRHISGNGFIWQAQDFSEVSNQLSAHKTDVIIIGLGVSDVVTEVKMLKSSCNSPILLLEAGSGSKHQKVFQCMGAGAVDVVKLPDSMDETAAVESLTQKLAIMMKLVKAADPANASKISLSSKSALIAIGSSTGGPAALSAILSTLPASTMASIVVVQHLGQQFSKDFIQWLDQHSALPVVAAKAGDSPRPGVVMVAGNDDHLILDAGGSLSYTEFPKDNPYRPSVNVFFDSVSKHWKGNVIGVLLTGMGKDGGEGMLALKHKGFPTIAEDKSTCVVYGMPKAAVDLGAATHVLPLHKITSAVIDCLNEFNQGRS